MPTNSATKLNSEAQLSRSLCRPGELTYTCRRRVIAQPETSVYFQDEMRPFLRVFCRVSTADLYSEVSSRVI